MVLVAQLVALMYTPSAITDSGSCSTDSCAARVVSNYHRLDTSGCSCISSLLSFQLHPFISESHGTQNTMIAGHSAFIPRFPQGHTRGVMKPRRMLDVSRTLFAMSGTSGQMRDAGRRATRGELTIIARASTSCMDDDTSIQLDQKSDKAPLFARMNMALDMHHERMLTMSAVPMPSSWHVVRTYI